MQAQMLMSRPRRATALPQHRTVLARIHIDRKRHIELAWQRQVAAEERLAAELQQGPEGRVWEVRDLAHLDKIHQVAGSRVVVLCAFSRSCGSCKQALKFFEAMAKQVHS